MKFLPLFFIFAVLVSGCVQAPEHKEIRYEDPDHPNENYLVMKYQTEDSGTFTLVTSTFVAGGSFTETSEAITLRYGEYPVGITLKKVEHGIDLGEDVYWYE